jgi:rhamnosyl/mannosyltransferase
MKLEVLHVAKFYPPVPGGMERVVQSLCSVARGRLDSRVLAFGTSRRTTEEVVDGVPVTRLGTIGAAGSVPMSSALFSALQTASADVMVLHEPNPWALLAYAVCRPRIPLVIWFHSEVVRPRFQYSLFYAPVAWPAYRDARRIVVSSAPLAHAAAIRTWPERLRVIPFGIDSARWVATDAVRQRAAEIRAQLGSPLVLFAGRLVAYKGVDVLIRAVAPLSIPAVVIGDGPMRERLAALAAQANGSGRITLAGEVDDAELHAYMTACDIFVLPSVTRAEAFGYVQLEAMASGKPVISTDLPSGVPWVNRHEETGLIVPPGDVDALRAAIARLAGDSELRVSLGAAGARRVQSDFSIEAMADRFVSVCHEAAGLRDRGTGQREPRTKGHP